jgi:hypothetical protein
MNAGRAGFALLVCIDIAGTVARNGELLGS